MPEYKFTCPNCGLKERRSTHGTRSFSGVLCPSCGAKFHVQEIDPIKDQQDEFDALQYLTDLKRDPKEEYYQ